MLQKTFLSAISIAIFFSLACTDVLARHHQRVEVQIGKSATEQRSKVKVEFLEVIEDSRCPADVNCIWAGNAKIKIRVTKNGKSEVIELNSGMMNKDNAFGGYTFLLENLTPKPISDKQIDKSSYVATIMMSREKKPA